MQRNWIGRSVGATVAFPVEEHEGVEIEVFTTRPDTLFGATYMVLAPEHPLLDEIVPTEWPDATLAPTSATCPRAWKGIFGTDVLPAEAVRRYREFAEQKSELERQAEGREKTGVFTGAFAKNPTNGWNVPIFVADYVLMGYGTGAIMAVPAHDERDFEFAQEFDLPIVAVVHPPDGWLRERGVDADTPADEWPEAYVGDGVGMNSSNDDVSLDGLPTPEAKRRDRGVARGERDRRADGHLQAARLAVQPSALLGRAVPDRLRRRRQPARAARVAAPGRAPRDHRLRAAHPRRRRPVAARSRRSRAPTTGSTSSSTSATAAAATGARRTRCRSGPVRAGTTCATSIPPTTTGSSTPRVEQYWMGTGDSGGVDLYVGGVEHAVLHLLYARFWHKVLYDLGHVSTPEPFHRLYNQGTLTAFEYLDDRGMYVEATTVEERDGVFLLRRASGLPAFGPHGQEPEEHGHARRDLPRLRRRHAAALRDVHGSARRDRAWSTADIAGVYRFLQRFWRNVVDEDTGELARVAGRGRRRDAPAAAPHDRRGASRHGNARVQHRDRAALRAQQPSHPGGRREQGSAPRRSGARDGADARPAHPARRRGALGEARSRGRRSRSRRSPCPTRRCSSTTRSRSRCR